jgi:hypothetical protein
MASPIGPTESIIELLSQELRAVILGLPRNLKDAVPEQLKFETGILAADETPKEKKRASDQWPECP